MYGHFDNDYRVATLSILYLTVLLKIKIIKILITTSVDYNQGLKRLDTQNSIKALIEDFITKLWGPV